MPSILPAVTHAKTTPQEPATTAASPIRPGDTVEWTNGSYRGTVLSVNCESAVVAERDNKLIGGDVKWRIHLDALTRLPGPAPKLPEDLGA